MRKTQFLQHPNSSNSFTDDDMMGLGSFVAPSSSSNLSPLAPPFTVERSNHNKPYLNPNLDSHFNSFRSSAARQGLLPDSITTPELINSPTTTTHNWSALNPVIKSRINAPNTQSAYNTEPYYYPCVSWSSDDDDPPINEDFLHNRRFFHGCGSSSKPDYSQNVSGLEGGLSGRKRLDSFFSEEPKITYMNQGAYGIDNLNKGKEDSSMFFGKHTNVVTEKNMGPSIIGKSLFSSGIEFSKEANFTAFPKSSESHPLVQPSAKEAWNNHTSYFPYETGSIFDCSNTPTITKSVVIKPPKSVEVCSSAVFISNDVKEKDTNLPVGFESKGSSSSLNKLSFQSDDDLLKSVSSFHFPDIKITKDGKSASNLSDHHNPAEDSPCWKGAPAHFSPFGSHDIESTQHPLKKLHASKLTEKDQNSAESRKENCFSSETNSQGFKLKLPNLDENVLLSGMGIRSTNEAVDQTLNASSSNEHALNVIVKAMNNLSELLLIHCSNDECGLKEQDLNALVQVIGNLNVCMSRKSQQSCKLPQRISTNLLQEGTFVANGTSAAFNFGKNVDKLQGTDDDLQKDHNMVQTIKKVLDENFNCNEELPTQSHTLLYKNLWLEAEAELCAFSYRARFHRVKREMAKSEASDVYEVASDIKKIPSSNLSPISPKLVHKAAGVSKTSTIPAQAPCLLNVDESSVMARFNILKNREKAVEVSAKEIQRHDDDDDDTGTKVSVEDSVMARLNVLKRRGESDGVHNIARQVLAQGGKEDEVGTGSGGMQNWLESGLSYSASSDWEHVLKDDFS